MIEPTGVTPVQKDKMINLKIGDTFEFAIRPFWEVHRPSLPAIVLKTYIDMGPYNATFCNCKRCRLCNAIIGVEYFSISIVYHQILVGNKKLIINQPN